MAARSRSKEAASPIRLSPTKSIRPNASNSLIQRGKKGREKSGGRGGKLEIRTNSWVAKKGWRLIRVMTPSSVRVHKSDRFPPISEASTPHKPRPPDTSLGTSCLLDVPKSSYTFRFPSPFQTTPKHPIETLFSLSKSPPKHQSSQKPPPLPPKPPLSSPQFPDTRLLSWSRRSSAIGKPLLLLNFEGVVGSWHRPSYSDQYELYLRPGWDAGVKLLSQKFEVALFTSLEKDKRAKLTEIFALKGVSFDAVYKKRKGDGTCFVMDYGQVIQHFGFRDWERAVVVVASVGIDLEDLGSREGVALIREETTSRRRRFLW